MPITLEQLQKEGWDWVKHNFSASLDKTYQPLLGVAEEVGELCHAHLKMELGIRNTSKADKEDAIGDIIIYLADYCNHNGINISKALTTAWETASKRDWIKYPKNGLTE